MRVGNLNLRSARARTLLLGLLVLIPVSALAADPRGGWQPEIRRLEALLASCRTSSGSIDVDVDAEACVTGAAPCAAFSPFPPATTNRNPVRLIVQVIAPEPVDDLTQDSFEIRTQFSPSGEGSVEPLTCPECFESREGGTYALWVLPSEELWEGGSYWLLLTATIEDGMLPALVRLDVPSGAQGDPPQAVVTISPPGEGQAGHPVIFDGSASFDPEGSVTCFQWQLLSDNPDAGTPNPEIVQGPGASGFQRTFQNEQTLAVTLLVSDRVDIVCSATEPEPEASFSPLASRTLYPIGCANPAPTAVIAGPDPIRATGTASTLTSTTLDGTLSSDGETPIDRYVWSCGNEFAPISVTPDGSVVMCRYRLGTYTATLSVTDQGTGVVDPITGTFECPRSSQDSVTIEIVPVQP